MTLAEAQALFYEAVTSDRPLPGERIDACFAGTPDLPAAERVAIYANMYLWRIVEALRETFPHLARFLGDERFAALAEDYVRRNPSVHHDIGQAGRRLAAFLREYPDPERPDLADLAELEWARHQVFFAPPSEPAGPELFQGLEPHAFARSGLAMSSALRVLALEHDVTDLFRQLEGGGPADAASPGACTMAVWRSGFEVFHCALSADEAVALRAALSGDSLERICVAFGCRDDPAAAAHTAISRWVSEGWVAGLAPA